MNEKRKNLKLIDNNLRDEYTILETDKNLLMRNRDLKGYNEGLKMNELKDAYAFMHQKLAEITNRQSAIENELEDLQKKMNQLEQEIISQRSKPLINYSEIDVAKITSANFIVNYISPNATWKPYYDMRSDGIGKPIRLEAKANVSQNTGIEWENVDMALSTNDPYQNVQEPSLLPWIIYYYNQPKNFKPAQRTLPITDFSGEKIRGEVIDASTGKPLPFTKVAFYGNPAVSVVTDFDGKFEITLPKGESYLNASYVGYENQLLYISAAYLKFFLIPEGIDLSTLKIDDKTYNQFGLTYQMNGIPQDLIGDEKSFNQVASVRGNFRKQKSSNKGRKANAAAYNKNNEYSSNDKRDSNYFEDGEVKGGIQLEKSDFSKSNGEVYKTIVSEKKDQRMEYKIVSKIPIPTDGINHRVSIATYDLNANYEYHVIPKMDPNVYLAALISGWEKLNLLSGESNIYFDGTFMGKSYLDVNSTKDTLSFSFGKDNKISVDRTLIKEKSKIRKIGSHQRFEMTWEIKIKNNGAALIPLIVKDQFPISKNNKIKVRQGEFVTGKLEKNTSIITWSFMNGITGSKSFSFDYLVDCKKGSKLYLE